MELSISLKRIAAPPLLPIMPKRPVAAVVAMNEQIRENQIKSNQIREKIIKKYSSHLEDEDGGICE